MRRWLHAYIHTYIHAYMHAKDIVDEKVNTCIHTCMQTCMHTYIHACAQKDVVDEKVNTCMHACTHSEEYSGWEGEYTHTYIQTHTQIRTFICTHTYITCMRINCINLRAVEMWARAGQDIHTLHTNKHTYIHTHKHTCAGSRKLTTGRAQIYKHAYIHTYIHIQDLESSRRDELKFFSSHPAYSQLAASNHVSAIHHISHVSIYTRTRTGSWIFSRHNSWEGNYQTSDKSTRCNTALSNAWHINTYIHAYIHTCTHTYIHTKPAVIPLHNHLQIGTGFLVHTHIHTHRTCIYTYTYIPNLCLCLCTITCRLARDFLHDDSTVFF